MAPERSAFAATRLACTTVAGVVAAVFALLPIALRAPFRREAPAGGAPPPEPAVGAGTTAQPAR